MKRHKKTKKNKKPWSCKVTEFLRNERESRKKGRNRDVEEERTQKGC